MTDTFDVALGAESAQVIAHGTGLDAQLHILLIGHCRAEALRQKLHARIMRQLPERSLRRIYLVIIFALLWGGGIALLLCYWQPIAASMLAVAASLLDHTLPSVETFTIFALCIGIVVLIVTQSRDALDEFYEYEIRQALGGCR